MRETGGVAPRRRWPASRRARAVARRRARVRARAQELEHRRALRRRVRRRRAAVLTALAATTGLGAALALVGLSLVRNSTAGEAVPAPPAADEPGYEAFVIPTPTLLLIHEDADGELAGLTLLTLHPEDDGGSVVLLPPSTLLPFGGDGEVAAGDLYRGGGSDALRGTVGSLLDIVVEDDLVIDDDRWASLIDPVAPLTVPQTDPVDQWPAGSVSLSAEEIGPFLAAQGPDESELDRLARHAELWNAWLPRVREAGAVPGEVDVGIGRFVRGLANDATVATLPVTPVEPDDDGTNDSDDATTEYALDETQAAELVASVVPFPVSPGPDSRLRVRLLNGTADDQVMPVANQRLVEAGAAIAVAGNAASFNVAETTFAYRPGVARQDIERLAEAFGVGTVELADPPGRASGAAEGTEAEIDVTLVLGRDAQDLIRRLDNG